MLTKLLIILQTAKRFAEIQSVQESFSDNLASHFAEQGKNNVREGLKRNNPSRAQPIVSHSLTSPCEG
jgi:hypothetical protein